MLCFSSEVLRQRATRESHSLFLLTSVESKQVAGFHRFIFFVAYEHVSSIFCDPRLVSLSLRSRPSPLIFSMSSFLSIPSIVTEKKKHITTRNRMAYTFPFDTCEPVRNQFPVQPYSFTINLLSTLALLGLSVIARTWTVRTLLVSFALFEAWHTLSHAIHLTLSPRSHIYVVHALGYFMTGCMLMAINVLSRNWTVPVYGLIFMSCLVILDLVMLFRVGGVSNILSGFALFVVVVLVNTSKLPRFVTRNMIWLISGVFLLSALFVNEALKCEKMSAYIDLPYHAIIEVVGFALFLGLGLTFLEWETHVNIKI